MEVLGLVPLDIVEPIDDPAADLEIGGALTDPAPALQGARGDIPAIGQLNLIEMPGGHSCVLQCLRNPAQSLAGVKGGQTEEKGRNLGRN